MVQGGFRGEGEVDWVPSHSLYRETKKMKRMKKIVLSVNSKIKKSEVTNH